MNININRISYTKDYKLDHLWIRFTDIIFLPSFWHIIPFPTNPFGQAPQSNPRRGALRSRHSTPGKHDSPSEYDFLPLSQSLMSVEVEHLID